MNTKNNRDCEARKHRVTSSRHIVIFDNSDNLRRRSCRIINDHKTQCHMKENNISQREQLFAITSAIILAGMVSNYTSAGVSKSNMLVARFTARELIDSILKDREQELE